MFGILILFYIMTIISYLFFYALSKIYYKQRNNKDILQCGVNNSSGYTLIKFSFIRRKH